MSYVLRILTPPLDDHTADGILKLLTNFGPHFGEYFAPDILARTKEAGNIFALLEDTLTGTVVSHGHICYDPRTAVPAVGLLGSVFTAAEHRRKGLSGAVLSVLLAEWTKIGGQCLVLGTGSPQAARVYQRHGFKHLLGGFSSGLQGYNPDDKGEWILARGAGSADFSRHTYFSDALCECIWEPFEKAHWPASIMLLTAAPGNSKLPTIGVHNGVTAELDLLVAMAKAAKKEICLEALVHPESRKVYGISVTPKGGGSASTFVVPQQSGLRSLSSSQALFSMAVLVGCGAIAFAVSALGKRPH